MILEKDLFALKIFDYVISAPREYKWERFLNSLLLLVSLLSYSFTIFDLYQNSDNAKYLMKNLPIIITSTSAYPLFYTLVQNKPVIIRCLKMIPECRYLSSFEKKSALDRFKDHSAVHKTLFWLLIVICTCSFIYFESNVSNQVHNDFTENFLQQRPQRDILNLFRCITTCYFGIQGLLASGIIMLDMVNMRLSFFTLKKKLGELKYIKNLRHRHKHMSKCVGYHQFIIGHWSLIMEMAMLPVFTFAVTTAVNVSLTVASIVKDSDFMSVFLLFWHLFQLMINCFLGESIIACCDMLEMEAFYAIPWDGDVQLALDLAFMARRCRRALYLKIGLIANYTNEFALSVFKFTYSLTMLLINTVQ